MRRRRGVAICLSYKKLLHRKIYSPPSPPRTRCVSLSPANRRYYLPQLLDMAKRDKLKPKDTSSTKSSNSALTSTVKRAGSAVMKLKRKARSILSPRKTKRTRDAPVSASSPPAHSKSPSVTMISVETVDNDDNDSKSVASTKPDDEAILGNV